MTRSIAITLLLVLAGCRDRINPSGGGLRLGQTRVEFPAAYVGQTKSLELEVTNTGAATRSASIATSLPFQTHDEGIDVPGASTVALKLSFAPDSVGTFEKLLVLEADDGIIHEALLVGTAQPPPDCVPSSPCRSSRFDLATGACIETAANEGIECSSSNACYLTAQCVQGQCVGTVRSCDDQNACTTDLCDAQKGCVHFEATARCAAPPDPCHVSACDPVKGCTFVDAVDGTRCGPSDCSTARVCILGQCKELPVPEGALCGDPSPCQPRGRCVANVCQRPPPTGLATAWTVWAPEGEAVAWDSLADEDGNIYWREYVPGSERSRIVSVSPTGARRWSQEVVQLRQLAVMNGMLIARFIDRYQARQLTDGALVWERLLNTPQEQAEARTFARGVGGSVYVGYVRFDGGTFGTTVASLNVFNGAQLWSTQLPEQAIDYQTMPADEGGYLYFGTWSRDNRRRYLSLSPTGQQRWQFTTTRASPAAVFGGRAYHWDHWLSETADGGWVNEEDPALQTSGYPRLALGAISFVGTMPLPADAGVCPQPAAPPEVMRLTRVDPATSKVKWMLDIASPDAGGRQITNTVLTSTNSVIFSQSIDYCDRPGTPHVLREVSPSGEPGFSCMLPGNEAYLGEGLLTGGRWIAALRSPDGGMGVRAIELPGFALPERGWATAWGSSARDNHAR